MEFRRTDIDGAYLVELEPHADDRGFFARTFCMHEFERAGVDFRVVQANIAYSRLAGTLRGMHFEAPLAGEAKVVRCTRGAVHDVVVDLDPASPSFLRHIAVRLDEENRLAIYVPDGFAHGYQSLTDDSEVSYLMGSAYAPERARGIRYDDPSLAIDWPLDVTSISERDLAWPPYSKPPSHG